ncbi:hypothetical protein [Curtobacterium sp. Leaf261]|uniref:hypothetical protein n=1 Tax=Curtobacterium sp. Leaf261 TaxID=1736311 RepID=UPI0012E1E98A|nr:hypothetical protein [Curtobacterium sp. Leaf261]
MSAIVAAAAVVASVLVGQETRRQLAVDRRRDRWWEQWSWIAEHAFSKHPGEQQAGVVMLETLTELAWSDGDDVRIAVAIQVERMKGEAP